MFVLRPIVAAVGVCLLQACMTTPLAKEELTLSAPTAVPVPIVEPAQLTIQPVMRVSHSANQSAATFYQLGKYHLEHGNFDFARSAYEASITMDGQQLDARNALAALDAQQGNLESAKALLVQIVADFPEVAHPYNNLGYVYYLQGNFEAADRTLQRAIALDAGNERARNNLNAVNMALARGSNRDALKMSMILPASGQEASITAASIPQPTEARTQSLAIISPAPEERIDHTAPQTRMEVVEVVPNIFQLRLKNAIDTVLADLNLDKKIPLETTMIAPLTMAVTLPLSLSNLLPVGAEIPANTSPVAMVLSKAMPSYSSKIDVANGNGVTGMAKRISDVLNRQGISVNRLSNELPYKQQETKILYRTGFEQTATGLKKALKGHAVIVLTSSLSHNTDVRLVLGKDVITHLALIEGLNSNTVLALNALAD